MDSTQQIVANLSTQPSAGCKRKAIVDCKTAVSLCTIAVRSTAHNSSDNNFRTDCTVSPDCLPNADTSEHIRFYFYFFPHFLVNGSVR